VIAEGAVWPRWRALFLVLGVVAIVLCTTGPLASRNHQHLWALATQLTLLVSIVPVLIALGDPLGLVRVGLSPRGRERWDALLRSGLVRVLTFPAVSAVLVTVWLMVVFFTGLLGSALHHGGVMWLVYLVSLVVGCLAALPMLGAELLPDWVTDPFRLLFAFVDGLLDAIPGIAVMTTHSPLAGGYFASTSAGGESNWDVHVAGSLMLALSEVVALPLFFIVFFRWASHEIGAQRERPDEDEPEFTTPWWETEESDVPEDGPAN